MIDTHCHPNMNTKKDKKAIIDSFFSDWWEAMITIWTNLQTSEEVIKIARENKDIFATIWIHPCDIENLDLIETIKKLEELYLKNKNKIVAIWEIWLDYFWINKDIEKLKLENRLKNQENYIKWKKELQKIFFRAQVQFAKLYNLPFVIHNREAKDDTFQILKEENYKNFVFHCYSEDLKYAKKILEFAPDSMISFSWILTFKNSPEVQETAKNIPEKNILAETDSPYLTPTPFRWKEENEPKFTKYVIEKISNLRWKNMDKIISENSKRFFWI